MESIHGTNSKAMGELPNAIPDEGSGKHVCRYGCSVRRTRASIIETIGSAPSPLPKLPIAAGEFATCFCCCCAAVQDGRTTAQSLSYTRTIRRTQLSRPGIFSVSRVSRSSVVGSPDLATYNSVFHSLFLSLSFSTLLVEVECVLRLRAATSMSELSPTNVGRLTRRMDDEVPPGCKGCGEGILHESTVGHPKQMVIHNRLGWDRAAKSIRRSEAIRSTWEQSRS